MSLPASRYRDRFLFALAYGAIIGAVLFLHPFDTPKPVEFAAGPVQQGTTTP